MRTEEGGEECDMIFKFLPMLVVLLILAQFICACIYIVQVTCASLSSV